MWYFPPGTILKDWKDWSYKIMNWNSGSLRMAIRPTQDGSQLHSVVAGIPVSIVLLLGMAISVCQWFPSMVTPWYWVFFGMLVFSAVLWLLRLTGKGMWTDIGMLILIFAVCLIFRKRFLGGMACLGNNLLDQMTRATGRIYLNFAVAEEDSVLWGIMPVLAMVAVLLHISIQTGKLLFFLPVLLSVYSIALTGFFPMDTGMVLIGFGSILLLMRRSGAVINGQGFWGRPSWVVVVLVCAITSAGIGTMLGDSAGKADSWKRQWHDLVYDQDTNSMPEGNLKNLKPWKKSDTPALKITMSAPQKLYLRGRIYETYEGTAWTSLNTEDQAGYESLFYWLHESGFFGQSQIGTASALVSEITGNQLTVENLSACSAHGYYPYALCGTESLNADMIGDTQLPGVDTLLYLPGSVPDWYGVQHSLAAAQGSDSVAQYLQAEEAYEAYVTAMNLQLTNESWSVLNRQLGKDSSPKTLAQIREYIRSYLEETLVYDESVRTLTGSGDFLQYTLEKSSSGYSVHYATAATLMLRYFGVPARYVEGYFISAEEAAAYQSGDPIILTEAHAHAWAEYYLPGVGFVPFEVTPGYIDDEELELGGDLTQNEQMYTGEHLKYAQVEQPERIEEPEQDRFVFSLKPIHLLYLLGIWQIVLVIIVLIKRKRFRRALAAIDAAPNRDAIAMRFGYAVKLLESCAGIQVSGDEQAARLNREALFSNHEMTDIQRTEMDRYAGHVLAACKEKWTVPQKLRHRFWDCLY